VVPVSPPEAWMLAEDLAARPEQESSRILERFQAAQQAVRLSDLAGKPLLSNAMEYFHLSIPCPFLEEEACTIHPQRPAACRDYLGTSSAWRCADPGLNTIDFVGLPVRMSECLSRVAARLLGEAPQMIPLIYALDWAEANREAGRLEWDSRTAIQMLLDQAGIRCSLETV
jgi:hypothetical protein